MCRGGNILTARSLVSLLLLNQSPSALTGISPLGTEKISPERIDVLSRLTAIALTLLGRYQITESICKQPTNSRQCDAILLGSVLKGLMGLGVYQPIPEAPYLGMTVMDLADKIENFPFMCDAAHGNTCGAAIKEEMKNTMKLMAEILSGVNGLELKNFKFKKGWGQVEGMIVTAAGDLGDVIQQSQRQQGHKEEEDEDVVALRQALNQEQDEQGRSEHGQQGVEQGDERQEKGDEENEDEEQEIAEQRAEEQGQVEGGGGIEAKTQIEDEDRGEDLSTAAVIDSAFENESGTSEMSEVPAGVMDGFLETEETMQDFGPRKFFDDAELDQTRDETLDGDDDQKSVIESPLVGNLVKGDESKEMVVANPLSMEELRVEIDKPVQYHLIQDGDIQNTKDMAYLTEQPLGVEDPENPEKQKEQLRPEAKDFIPSFPLGPAPPERNRHHMPRSRRDMARPLRPAETLTHMASRANAEAKGQQWETPGPALVRKYQRGSRIPFHPEVTVRDVSDPDHIARVKRLKERFPQLDSKIIFECLRQNNWNSEETAKVLSSGRIQTEFAIDSTVKFPVLEPTILHTQKPIVSSHQVSSGPSTTSIQYSSDSAVKPPPLEALEAPGEAPKAHNNTTNVPQPVSSVPNPSVTDSTAHFWPPADSATVLRAVKLPENSLTIRKLLAIFPSARADKSFIDVLYRSGWDLEQAAKRLEGLGLVRKASSGDAGDAGKLKGKGKAKAKGEGKINM